MKAVGGVGGYWRLEMRLGLVLGYGNSFGVESGQWGGGSPPPPFKRFPGGGASSWALGGLGCAKCPGHSRPRGCHAPLPPSANHCHLPGAPPQNPHPPPPPSAVWARHGAVEQGQSGGSVGTTRQGKGRGCRGVGTGQAEGEGGHEGGRGRWAPPRMEGVGSRERTRVSGERLIGAARFTQRYIQASCQPPAPPPRPRTPQRSCTHFPAILEFGWEAGRRVGAAGAPPSPHPHVPHILHSLPRTEGRLRHPNEECVRLPDLSAQQNPVLTTAEGD